MRFPELDFFRGIGILMVIIYHFFFDLYFFGVNNLVFSLPILFVGRSAAIILILVSGISLSVSISKWEGKKDAAIHHAKHVLFLAATAMLITAGTWIYPHSGFIFFGIIHFLAVATLIGMLLARSRMAMVAVVLLSLPAWLVLQTQPTDNMLLSAIGFNTSLYTLDLFSIFPWMGVFCAGMLIGQKMYGTAGRKFSAKNIPHNWLIELMGKNSLAIYLVHQLVLIGLLQIVLQIKN